jgi:hypothetical protein
MNESNLRVELEEVWVPKDAGELEGLLLAIQNEPGKKILKHKIQQVVKERKRSIAGNWGDHYRREWEDWEKWPDVHEMSEWNQDYVDHIDTGGIDYTDFSRQIG